MKLLTYIDIRMTAATGSGEKSLAKFRQLRTELERLYGDSTPLLALASPAWTRALSRSYGCSGEPRFALRRASAEAAQESRSKAAQESCAPRSAPSGATLPSQAPEARQTDSTEAPIDRQARHFAQAGKPMLPEFAQAGKPMGAEAQVKSHESKVKSAHPDGAEPQATLLSEATLLSDSGSPERSGSTERSDLMRRLARSAIRDGFLPNVDAFPADEERVRGAYAVSGPDMKREFDRLLRFVNARAGRLTATERSLLPYLYALLAGCELDDLWRADVPRVDGLGEDLRTLYNGPRYAGEELFNLKVKPGETPDQALQTLKRTLQKTLSANDITLFRDRSAITDRLAIAVSAGAPAAAVMAVADKVVAGEPYAEEMRALDRWVRDDHGYLKKYWRVLCSYSPRLNAEKMQTRVRGMRAELPEDVEFGEVKTYLPHETVVRARGGKVAPRVRPVMGRYLFVRSSLSDCQTLERYLADASFLRCTDRPQQRAVISEGELRRLMSFMKDYGDDLDVVDMAQWARDHEVNLKDGQRVRIENGPYAGYEGVIIQTKRRPDASGATKLFVVQVAGLPNLAIAGNVTARLRGLELLPL